jgi:hypothetical protein
VKKKDNNKMEEEERKIYSSYVVCGDGVGWLVMWSYRKEKNVREESYVFFVSKECYSTTTYADRSILDIIFYSRFMLIIKEGDSCGVVV